MSEQIQDETKRANLIVAIHPFIDYANNLLTDFEARITAIERKLGINNAFAQSQSSETEKDDYFYFAGVANGQFSKPSPSLEENSLYRFKKIDKDKASVYVIENSLFAAQKFANSPDSHETACEYLNQCPENFSGVKTIEPGEAVLIDNNKWKISTKVKIEYLG